jgi:hypothetical protein
VRADPATFDARLATLRRDGPASRAVVCVCVHGHQVSQGAAAKFANAGFNATYLDGGIEAWRARGAPLMRKIEPLAHERAQATRWVTRERPKIDRIACPWLVRRFIDPYAEFLYVPSDQVRAVAARENAIAYDVPGVTFTHRGEQCSFDAFIADFDLRDAALDVVATIVRGADTDRLDLAPQSAGLLAVSLGLSRTHTDDHAMLAAAMPVYDALYAWVRDARDEAHNAALFEKKN